MPIHDPLDDPHQSIPRLIDASVLRADLRAFEYEGDLGRGLLGVGKPGLGAHADHPAGLVGLVLLDPHSIRRRAVSWPRPLLAPVMKVIVMRSMLIPTRWAGPGTLRR